MALFVCPNEVLEQIIRETIPDDLENLAATCKLLHELAGPLLKEHYILKRKYDFRINYPAKKALHPVEILDAIVENPRAVEYVKALSLTYRAPAKQNEKLITNLLEKHDCFWHLLISNPFVPDGEVYSWYSRIKEGHVDAVFALLVYYLHNLREVRIQRPILIPMTSVMISRLKSCIGLRELEELSYGTHQYKPRGTLIGSKQPLGLAKLERVIIDPAASSEEAHLRNRLGDFARFASFSSFPKLQHLNGISLCSRKYNMDQSFSGFQNLRSIRLVNCNIAADSFHSLFSGIKNLESFHYTPTSDVRELTDIVDDLKKYAGHSLTRLYLRHCTVETRSEAWKYRGFEHLKRLDVDWHCLVHYEEQAVASSSTSSTNPPPSPRKTKANKVLHPALVDLMPASVESIKIVDLDGKANLEAIRWLFFKLAMRISRLPNLKVVIFVTPRRDCWMHAKDMCSRAGLKFPSYSCDKERRISGLEFVYE